MPVSGVNQFHPPWAAPFIPPCYGTSKCQTLLEVTDQCNVYTVQCTVHSFTHFSRGLESSLIRQQCIFLIKWSFMDLINYFYLHRLHTWGSMVSTGAESWFRILQEVQLFQWFLSLEKRWIKLLMFFASPSDFPPGNISGAILCIKYKRKRQYSQFWTWLPPPPPPLPQRQLKMRPPFLYFVFRQLPEKGSRVLLGVMLGQTMEARSANHKPL